MRFFYYYPTNEKPAGGNKQLRLQAMLLRELGVETFLLRDERYFARPEALDDTPLYGIPVEVAPVPFERAADHLTAGDVLVLPEVLLRDSLARCANWRCRVAVNNQNGFYGIMYGPPRRACRARIEFAIANAPFVADLCHRDYGVPRAHIFLIPYWIDRPPFGPPAPGEVPELAVGYMPRKLPEVNAAVREAVQRAHPDVPWVEIDGLPEAGVTERFRRLAVFFAAQDVEGFGMPAIEAMACGCLVAGFPGTGRFPHPYATPENGLWAPDRNVKAAIDAVSRAIAIAKAGGPTLEAYRQAARRTLARYSREPARAAIAEMAKTVAERSYATRTGPAPVLGWRHDLYLLRLLYNSDRLGWPGRCFDRFARLTKPLRRLLSGRPRSGGPNS